MAMVRRKMTQHALAEKVGEGDPWVHRRLTGRAEITVKDLYRIAAALDVEASSLLPRSAATRWEPRVRVLPERRSLLPGERPVRYLPQSEAA